MQTIQELGITPLGKPVFSPLTRIMSVDDETVDQMVCARVVKRANIAEDLVSFATPAAALSYFANPDSPPVDLILLDVNMPRMNGFEFLEAAHRLITLPAVPPVLLMLTSPLGPQHREHAQVFEVIRGYLDKPLTQFDLESAIAVIQTTG